LQQKSGFFWEGGLRSVIFLTFRQGLRNFLVV
jgi:hypothetical protein